MPLMEVVLEQVYNGQQCINRWNYMASGTPGGTTLSFGLISALGFLPTSTTLLAGSVGAELQSLQNPSVRFVQATVRGVFLDDDFYGSPFLASTFGTRASQGEPITSVNAFGFRSTRVKQSIGRGYKRFVGMSEGVVGDYGNLTSPTLTQMTAVADAMSDTLSFDDEGSTLSYVPCIAQKLKYTTPSGKTAYKYYSTETLQAPHNALGISWEGYNTTRTQVSRQVGRGS